MKHVSRAGPVFSYKLRDVVGFGLVEMVEFSVLLPIIGAESVTICVTVTSETRGQREGHQVAISPTTKTYRLQRKTPQMSPIVVLMLGPCIRRPINPCPARTAYGSTDTISALTIVLLGSHIQGSNQVTSQMKYH